MFPQAEPVSMGQLSVHRLINLRLEVEYVGLLEDRNIYAIVKCGEAPSEWGIRAKAGAPQLRDRNPHCCGVNTDN